MVKAGLTIDEVAARYEVNRSTVHRWIRNGKLKPTVFCGRKYFTEDALKEMENNDRGTGEAFP